MGRGCETDGAATWTKFAVRSDFLRRYQAHAVGGEDLRELWVPAEELHEFCTQIVGPIEVIG